MLSHLQKPIVLNRLVGKSIDLVLMIALASIPLYPANALAAFLYVLICDGFKGGRSLGKRVTGLRVVNTTTGKPASFQDSIVRNCTIAIPVLFFMVPIVGWGLWFLFGIPLLAFEIYLMTRLDQHARLGDTMADTQVESLTDQ